MRVSFTPYADHSRQIVATVWIRHSSVSWLSLIEGFCENEGPDFATAQRTSQQKTAVYERELANHKQQVSDKSTILSKIEELPSIVSDLSSILALSQSSVQDMKALQLAGWKKFVESTSAAASAEHVAYDLRIKLQASEKESEALLTALQDAKAALADHVVELKQKTALSRNCKFKITRWMGYLAGWAWNESARVKEEVGWREYLLKWIPNTFSSDWESASSVLRGKITVIFSCRGSGNWKKNPLTEIWETVHVIMVVCSGMNKRYLTSWESYELLLKKVVTIQSFVVPEFWIIMNSSRRTYKRVSLYSWRSLEMPPRYWLTNMISILRRAWLYIFL